MAFVDNQMTVIGNDISDLSSAYQALDERHINDAGRLSFSTPDNADLFRVDVQKGTQALHPLSEEFPAMNENQRVAGSMRDECGRDNRLAKGGRGGEHAVVVGNKSVKSPGLRPSQFALERNASRQRRSITAMIVQNGGRPVTLDELDSFVEAAARQSNMSRMKLGA